ncbi:MAG: FAD-dependent oxidoreductase [Planctomycetota bacterium]|nr:MAG: FAD-dependent oxidoreductase [Planctomycetota bacterium]
MAIAAPQPAPVDVVVLGGGIAGLWTLRRLVEAGLDACLLERRALGAGQSIASQGIIHSGLKYTLRGAVTGAARAMAEAPDIWRACLRQEREPSLPPGALLSERCWLWRTRSLRSQAALLGARAGLKTRPVPVPAHERPAALRDCPGEVYSVEEPVVSPGGVLEALAAPVRDRLALTADADDALDVSRIQGRLLLRVRLADGTTLALAPRALVLTAGTGAEALRAQLGLATQALQRRPLHMVLARGPSLPRLFGHCVDGAATRVTVTSAACADGSTVWQVGGRIAEQGVGMDEPELLRLARSELAATLPGVDFTDVRLACYRIDRVEARTATGAKPDRETVFVEGPIVTALPTKLALAPLLADRVLEAVEPLLEAVGDADDAAVACAALACAPRPAVAPPPWESQLRWR